MKDHFRLDHNSCIVKLEHTWYITMNGDAYELTKDRAAATRFTQSTLPDLFTGLKNIQFLH